MENFKYELFNVRLDIKKYLIVKNWWERRKWKVPTPKSLSTTGIMIYKDDYQPICAGWLYQTDSSMAIVGFIIADLETIGKTKKNAIEFLLVQIEKVAKDLGFSSLSMPTSSNGIARLGINNLDYVGEKINELHKLL